MRCPPRPIGAMFRNRRPGRRQRRLLLGFAAIALTAGWGCDRIAGTPPSADKMNDVATGFFADYVWPAGRPRILIGHSIKEIWFRLAALERLGSATPAARAALREQYEWISAIGCDRARGGSKNLLEAALGLAFEQAGEPLGVGTRQLPEIGRALCQPRRQRAEHGVSREQPLERLAGGRARDLAEPIADAHVRRLRGAQPRRRGDALSERTC